MHAEETKDKGEKEKSNGFNCAPLGHGMFEMMRKCCAGRGEFPDCSTLMEGMMEAMKKQQCCTPNKDAAESDRRKK